MSIKLSLRLCPFFYLLNNTVCAECSAFCEFVDHMSIHYVDKVMHKQTLDFYMSASSFEAWLHAILRDLGKLSPQRGKRIHATLSKGQDNPFFETTRLQARGEANASPNPIVRAF